MPIKSVINYKISRMFYDFAEILELMNIDWKPQAYRKAAQILDTYDSVEEIYKKKGLKGLEEIPSVGEGIAEKIEEFLKTGKIKEFEDMKKKLPFHISVLMKIPGLGAKRINRLNKVLKIRNISDLKQAIKSKKISSIRGFGEKSEKDILENLKLYELRKKNQEYISLKEAETIFKKIYNQLIKLKEIKKILCVGSVRRKKALINDIDILVLSKDFKKVVEKFISLKEVFKVINKGERKATIILKNGIQCDLRIFNKEEFGAGLLYFTGSKNFNIELRKKAIKRGFKLNEYGIFNKKTGKRLGGKTEKEIFDILGERYLKPEERE
jgi:DNA polymerase (family 10)